MLILSEVQKAYIAGIMDGEGSIYIARATNHYNKKSRRIYHQLRLIIANTNREMLVYIKNSVGYGAIVQFRNVSNNHKAVYTYQLCALKAKELLEAIYPFLIIKKAQANIAFEFAKTIREKNNNKCGCKGLEDSVIDIREKCKIALNALNGNNGGHKSRVWKNKGRELGEPLTGNADGNPEPSNRLISMGVRRD